MSRSRKSLGAFGHLRTSFDGRGPEGSASDMLNVRAGDQTLRPRKGIRTVSAPPTNEGTVRALGLVYLAGYGDDYAYREEWLSVESRGGTIRPYALDPVTGARTVVTNAGNPVALTDRAHYGFVFGGRGYVVAPGAATTVYRHEIGNAASFVPIANTTYTPPPTDPTFSTAINEFYDVAYTPGSDTAVFSAAQVNGDSTTITPTAVECRFNGNDDNGVDGGASLTHTYAAPVPITTANLYLSIAIEGGPGLNYFLATGAYLRISVGGNLYELENQKVTLQNSTTFNISGTLPIPPTAPFNISGFVVAWRDRVKRGVSSGLFAKVFPLQIGGKLLNATSDAQRPWNGNVPSKAITYGARTRDTVTGVVSDIVTATQNAAAILGPNARDAGFALGVSTAISYDPPTPYTNKVVQFVRVDANGVKRLLSETAAAANLSFTDSRREDQVQLLDPVTGDATPIPDGPPPFSGERIVYGVEHLGSVAWLTSGGKENVKYSRVGEPEEIKVGDPAYDDGDFGHPDTYTMAENFADEPVGGVSAGQALIILGRKAAYTQSGDYPKDKLPCRQISGSHGCVGSGAFARYRPDGGEYGCAYLDGDGNVWFVRGSYQYVTDAGARPVEMSLEIRGFVRGFLLDQPEFAFTDLSGASMDVDEADGSLWITLGRRALVLRNEGRGWEPYEYNLAGLPVTQQFTSAWLSASSPTQSGGGASWSYGPPDTVTLVSAAASSQLLSRTGFLAGLPPVGQTVVSVEARLTGVADPLLAIAFAPNVGARSATLGATRLDRPEWYDPDNWSLGTLPFYETEGNPPTYPPDALILVAQYTGAAPYPPSTLWDATGYTEGGVGSGTGFGQIGSATVSYGPASASGNWQSGTFGPVLHPESVSASGVARTAMTRVPGTLRYEGPVPSTAASSGGGPGGSRVAGRVNSAQIVGPAPIAYSGQIEMRMTYEVTTLPPPIGIHRLAFAPGDRRRWIRTDGRFDEIERDSRTGTDILGTLRDAGLAMPDWRWISALESGARRRPTIVEAERHPLTAPLAALVRVDGTLRAYPLPPRRSHVRMGVTIGRRVGVGLSGGEDLLGVDLLSLETTLLSERTSS